MLAWCACHQRVVTLLCPFQLALVHPARLEPTFLCFSHALAEMPVTHPVNSVS